MIQIWIDHRAARTSPSQQQTFRLRIQARLSALDDHITNHPCRRHVLKAPNHHAAWSFWAAGVHNVIMRVFTVLWGAAPGLPGTAHGHYVGIFLRCVITICGSEADLHKDTSARLMFARGGIWPQAFQLEASRAIYHNCGQLCCHV